MYFECPSSSIRMQWMWRDTDGSNSGISISTLLRCDFIYRILFSLPSWEFGFHIQWRFKVYRRQVPEPAWQISHIQQVRVALSHSPPVKSILCSCRTPPTLSSSGSSNHTAASGWQYICTHCCTNICLCNTWCVHKIDLAFLAPPAGILPAVLGALL